MERLLNNEILEPVAAEVRCKINVSSTEIVLLVTAGTKSEVCWSSVQPGGSSVLQDTALLLAISWSNKDNKETEEHKNVSVSSSACSQQCRQQMLMEKPGSRVRVRGTCQKHSLSFLGFVVQGVHRYAQEGKYLSVLALKTFQFQLMSLVLLGGTVQVIPSLPSPCHSQATSGSRRW